MAPHDNPTGFEPRRMVAASQQPSNDPWKRHEAWRYNGQFSRYRRLFKGSFPGFGIASVAFAAYCGYEYLFVKDDHHGPLSGGHGEDKH